jgi:hypothetical protein
MHCSCVFSYSYSYSVRRGGRYSYSKRFSMAIRPIGLQVPANCLGQRSASPQFEQPSSTSTASLSTASLSTSTTKFDAMNERLRLTESEEETLHKSKTLDRALRSNAWFVLLFVLVLEAI